MGSSSKGRHQGYIERKIFCFSSDENRVFFRKTKGEIVDNNFRFALFNACYRPACRLLDEAVFCRFRIA